MKKILAMLLTLLMLLSFVTVSFASEKVLNPTQPDIKSESGTNVTAEGIALSKNGYIGFKGVSLRRIILHKRSFLNSLFHSRSRRDAKAANGFAKLGVAHLSVASFTSLDKKCGFIFKFIK